MAKKKKSRVLCQGDIYIVNYGDSSEIVGCEQASSRPSVIISGVIPSLIVSNNIENKFAKIISVVPITSKLKKVIPTHHILNKEEYDFLSDTNNTVLGEQARCISIDRVQMYLGSIDEKDLDIILQKVKDNYNKIELTK